MKSSLFTIEISENNPQIITAYGYNTDFSVTADSLESCLKKGKVIHQTQTTDAFGKTIITLSIQVDTNI